MIRDKIIKILADHPPADLRTEINHMKKAVMILAERIDQQDQEMKTTHKVAEEILIAIGKLDEKIEKAGL